MGNRTTWRKLITRYFEEETDDGWDDVIGCTLNGEELDTEFDCGFGRQEGQLFTLWTNRRVYFSIAWDGAQWVESVPRFPCDEKVRIEIAS